MISPQAAPADLATLLRRALMVILAIGLVGTGAELVLLEHTEDTWQWLPIVLILVALLVQAWLVMAPGRPSVLAMRTIMSVCAASGFLGLFLHYRGNAEFELEMYPSLTGFDLFLEAISGATPTLAPGAMTLLGLIGLLYTFRHPALGRPAECELSTTDG